MANVKQAVILAGGKGTRLLPLTENLPKPMIKMHGKPFLEYLINMLKEQGIEEVVLLLGYKAEHIRAYFGDGKGFGIRITYSIGSVETETGKRIKDAEELIQDCFLLLYCDNYWPLNLRKLESFANAKKTLMSVTVYSNKDSITKNNTLVEDGMVKVYDKTRMIRGLNGVEIGYFIVQKKVLDLLPEENVSFEKTVFPKLIKERQLAGYLTDQRYYSIGNIDRLDTTKAFLSPKKVIFLDRDGVINKKAPKAEYVKSWDEFVFLPKAKEAITLLTQKGYDIYIISNQAGIARGKMTEEDLADIHKHMLADIEKEGGKIKQIYHCPHGWDEDCECRKPKPGMFLQASKDHHIDLTKTIFIGDDERDKEAGDAAGCKTILIEGGRSLKNIAQEIIIGKQS